MVIVAAAILSRDGRILIARRKPGLRYAGKWEFPGGKVESGETPDQTLAREMYEEFDIEVSVGDLFAESIFAYDCFPVHIFCYRVFWLSGEMELRDHDQMAWVKPEELTSYDLLAADVPLARKLIESS